jgi:hypothetical protein
LEESQYAGAAPNRLSALSAARHTGYSALIGASAHTNSGTLINNLNADATTWQIKRGDGVR